MNLNSINKSSLLIIVGTLAITLLLISAILLSLYRNQNNMQGLPLWNNPEDAGISLEYQLSPTESAQLDLEMQEEFGQALSESTVLASADLGFTITMPKKYSVLVTEAFQDQFDTNHQGVRFNLPVASPRDNGVFYQTAFGISRFPIGTDTSGMGPITILASDNQYTYAYFQSMDVAIDPDLPEYEIFLSLAGPLEDVKRGFRLVN